MTDERVIKFIKSVGHPTMISAYGTDDGDDETIKHFIWLLDVTDETLCEVQDEAIELAFQIYDPYPVPFVIGVADPEKSQFLRTESQTVTPSSTAAAGVSVSAGLSQPETSGAQPGVSTQAVFVLGARDAHRGTNTITGPHMQSGNGLAYAY